jgi:hypothetical protein
MPKAVFHLLALLPKWLLTGFVFLCRWATGAPRKRTASPLRLWAARIIPAVCAIWLATLGPGNLFLPFHIGFASVSGKHFAVYYQDGISNELVKKVIAYSDAAHTSNRGFWGEPPGGIRKVPIYLCHSRSRFKQLSGWAGGNAALADSSIVMYPAGVGETNLAAVIAHEMSHAYLAQHEGYMARFRVPAWLDDGIATYLGTPTWASQNSLQSHLEAMPNPQIVSATSLTNRLRWSNGFRRPWEVVVNYAYARSLTEYLILHYGTDKLRTYLRQASFLKDSNDLFASVFSIDLRQVEQSWLDENKSLGRIPQNTELVSRSLSPITIIQFSLKYGFLALCILWLIRQCFRLGRYFHGLRRRAIAIA